MGLTRMDVEISMPIYETDGEDKNQKDKLIVRSHWNRTADLVVVVVGGKAYTVGADAISKAVSRATGF